MTSISPFFQTCRLANFSHFTYITLFQFRDWLTQIISVASSSQISRLANFDSPNGVAHGKEPARRNRERQIAYGNIFYYRWSWTKINLPCVCISICLSRFFSVNPSLFRSLSSLSPSPPLPLSHSNSYVRSFLSKSPHEEEEIFYKAFRLGRKDNTLS